MYRAPDHVVPGRPVPEAAEQHDDHQIHVGTPRRASVPTERYVEKIPKPLREGDMPSPPEFTEGGGQIRVVEIHWEPEPEHIREAPRNARVSREITEDLTSEEQRAQDQDARVRLRFGTREDGFHKWGQVVCADHLQEEAANDQVGAFMAVSPAPRVPQYQVFRFRPIWA